MIQIMCDYDIWGHPIPEGTIGVISEKSNFNNLTVLSLICEIHGEYCLVQVYEDDTKELL